VFIPPFIRAVHSLFSLIRSQPSDKILQLHKKCIILFQSIYLILQLFFIFIIRFFYNLEYKILPTGSSENSRRSIPNFYLFFACIVQIPQKISPQSALSPILEPNKIFPINLHATSTNHISSNLPNNHTFLNQNFLLFSNGQSNNFG
jgi:hypothetical protein